MKENSERGFKCPYCGEGKLKVLYTFPMTHEIKRERLCLFCGAKKPSTEKFDELWEEEIKDTMEEGYRRGFDAATKLLQPLIDNLQKILCEVAYGKTEEDRRAKAS